MTIRTLEPIKVTLDTNTLLEIKELLPKEKVVFTKQHQVDSLLELLDRNIAKGNDDCTTRLDTTKEICRALREESMLCMADADCTTYYWEYSTAAEDLAKMLEQYFNLVDDTHYTKYTVLGTK